MKINPNLDFLLKNGKNTRIILLQGGTRSGKTVASCQYLCKLLWKYSGIEVSIVRKSNPVLVATVLKDFERAMAEAGIINAVHHMKKKQQYMYKQNVVDYFSVDNEQKLRGRGRHILYANEINELSHYEFKQLAFRTTGLIIGDYNPSMPTDHWIFNNVINRPDCKHIVTTYRDNPFLSEGQIQEIEMLQYEDPELWKVYGQGTPGNLQGLIYKNWSIFSDHEIEEVDEQYYGLDFGFSQDPCAIVHVGIVRSKPKGRVYLTEMLYQTGLTTSELIQVMSEKLNKAYPIYADPSRPDTIEEIRRAGFTIYLGINKINDGIESVRKNDIFVYYQSLNVQKELRMYKWKQDSSGNILPVPIGVSNDAMDAIRYPIHTTNLTGSFSTSRLNRPRKTW
jgi:phage terminase large subunit